MIDVAVADLVIESRRIRMTLEKIIGEVLESPQRLGRHSCAVKFRAILVERPSQNRRAEPLGQPELHMVARIVKTSSEIERRTRLTPVGDVACSSPAEDIVGRDIRSAFVGVEN